MTPALEGLPEGGDAKRAHIPVLYSEAIEALITNPQGIYVDGTTGLGGHAEGVLAALAEGGRLIAVDRDEQALCMARERLGHFGDRVRFAHGDFRTLGAILDGLAVKEVDGILLDLGVSSMQLDVAERGFSFAQDGPLDMRMDRSTGETAADLVNRLPEEELADIIYQFGEERRSRAIARRVVQARMGGRIATTRELADIVRSVIGRPPNAKIHPATRVFQALRIAVNSELEGLDTFLEEITGRLVAGGRLVVIAFHSLEDRLVKTTFRRLEGRCVCKRPAILCRCPKEQKVKVLTKKPLQPQVAEMASNPRSRSAKMRVIEKVASLPIERGGC